MIDLLAREVVLVEGEVVVVLTQRQIIHRADEIFKLWILLAGQLLDLLPDFFSLSVLFSFSVDMCDDVKGRGRDVDGNRN